ncbi:hypothetical protein F4678DRAFT_484017 [Xylaria arbuscula]|nr:hypothetical protein F4678DRAFT_484017 [Xylaria arbuscula]
MQQQQQQSTRQSRRSACDRCRKYKLRCQRSSPSSYANDCDRCIRVAAACSTTPTGFGKQLNQVQISRARHPSISGVLQIRDLPLKANSSSTSSTSLRLTDQLHSTRDRANSPGPMDQTLNDTMLSPPPSQFESVLGPGTWPSTTVYNEQGHQEHLQSWVPSSRNDELTSCDSDVVLDSSAVAENDPLGDDWNSLEELLSLCAKLATDLVNLRGRRLDISRLGQSKPLENTVQIALDRSGELSDLLGAVAAHASSAQQSRDSPMSRSQLHTSFVSPIRVHGPPPAAQFHHPSELWSESWQTAHQPLHSQGPAHSTSLISTTVLPQQADGRDVVITVTLINAYILLVRIWRHTYSHLHHILLSGNPTDKIDDLLALPSLQLGGFQLGNNAILKVECLCELGSSMLRGIEQSLGISDTLNANSATRSAASRGLLPSTDAVSISIREMLISQESLRISSEGDGLTLPQLIQEIKHQLRQKR